MGGMATRMADSRHNQTGKQEQEVTKREQPGVAPFSFAVVLRMSISCSPGGVVLGVLVVWYVGSACRGRGAVAWRALRVRMSRGCG
jgi:hypothetical protein